MRVVVIGGSGHIGSFLTPRLVNAGYEVVSVTRSNRQPYVANPAWRSVEQITLDRTAGTFSAEIVALGAEVVIDLICYTLDEACDLAEALRGRVRHFMHCGTIWVHGPGVEVPVTEEQPRRPISDYGRRKAAIEDYLLGEARTRASPATVLHPGHLVGPGWMPLNPAANFNPRVFTDLARGNEVALPNFGLETVHHVHADDVAQAFEKSIAHRSSAVGEAFHVVSPAALTLRGYAEMVASGFGKEARLRFLPWDEWRQSASEKDAAITWDHVARSPNCSIAKARRLIDYSPRYSSIEAVRESLAWMIENRVIEV
ncbi:MAG TPA: NAD(P)-dependent oxidoreductase [Bryobacteraceae bacterium]|nr:NAD(P)-dependent oxidoreductase [Bryobacteraceae bacterium]